MPRFLHTLDPDLSDLNAAKRNVNLYNKKQYSGQDGTHDNLGQTADVDSIYNTLSTRLLGLQVTLQDLFNILEVGSADMRFFSPQQRATLQQFASRVLVEVNAVQIIMSKIKGFNKFTPPQAEGLGDLVSQISALNDFITGIASTLEGVAGQQISDIILTYEPQIKLLLQFLEGASSNYKSLSSAVPIEGRGRGGVAYHYRPATMTGGAIVPAFNGEGVYGSDGYRIGDYYTYNDPRRFY